MTAPTNTERTLRRLLVLNDYGFEISNVNLDTNTSAHEFLSDEWLEEWYGPGWCESYVQDALDAVDLLMSVSSLSSASAVS